MITTTVVGLGRIGSGNDCDSNQLLQSHIGSILKCKGMQVGGLVDIAPMAIESTILRWPELRNTPRFSNISSLPHESSDVIVLSTPLENRLKEVRDALTKNPKVLLVEKPLANDPETGWKIVQLVSQSSTTLRINYHRRFDPGHQKFHSALPGIPKKIIMRYNKGLLNYASHLVDLLLDWFGPIREVQAIGSSNNKQLSFCCSMEANFEAIIIGVDDVNYDQFEIDLFFEKDRFELASGGCEKFWQKAEEDVIYPGYTHLGSRLSLHSMERVGGFQECYEGIRGFIEHGDPLGGCDGETAIDVLKVLKAVVDSSQKGIRVKLISGYEKK